MNAFQKTLAAAKAEKFAVVEGGFLLEENDLNNIEASLATIDAATKTAEDLAAATKRADEAAIALTTAAEQAKKDQARITELEGQVAKLDKKPASEFSATTTEKDKPANEQPAKSKYHMAIDDEAAKYR